jgi:hypothetical protein
VEWSRDEGTLMLGGTHEELGREIWTIVYMKMYSL